MLRMRTLTSRVGSASPSRLLAFLLACTTFVPSPRNAQESPPQEVSTREVEPTFTLKAQTNQVLVRVVVRDAKGATVDNLRQEDFQLYDRGKLQTIVHFSLEKPGLKTAEPNSPKPAEKAITEPEATEETAAPASIPRRFVALYFDDVNTPFENLAPARNAADHFLTSSVQPGDRVALYTASGQKQLDFTDDLPQVHQALLDLRARPIVSDDRSCGTMPPYEAYLIVYNHDATATQVATIEIANCLPCSKNTLKESPNDPCYQMAQSMVPSKATESLADGETQSTAALRGIESVVRRLTSLPGQRSMVIVSGGFLTETLRFELSQISERALRGGVILNALDARGLYSSAAIPDASQHSIAYTSNPGIIAMKTQILVESARRQTDGMQSLALDTGGVFFNNSNDLEAGFRKAAALPGSFYLLAFSPQNLKLDGNFHPLQVKLVSAKGLSVQARRGYYAPKKPTDPSAQEKEEIQEAVFSPDETHNLPIDVHTQFFMKSESEASISVLTHLDLHELQFRKGGDRNLDNVTFVTAVFDQDGHLVSGQQKSVDMHLLDDSLQRYRQTGITSRSNFDVKRGTYVVRAIVRDSASGQMSALNRTVEIPY